MAIQVNLIESDLAALRWPAASADLNAVLSRIGNFEHYLLLLIDGKLAVAPDEKPRLLAAVFTSDDSPKRTICWTNHRHP